MNKRFLMKMLAIVSVCMFFIACNNDSTNESSKKDSTSPSSTAGTWTKEDELEFVDGCVENAKARFGEAEAYSYCRCIFNQVKTKYTSMDSATILKLQDTAEVAKMAKNCD